MLGLSVFFVFLCFVFLFCFLSVFVSRWRSRKFVFSRKCCGRSGEHGTSDRQTEELLASQHPRLAFMSLRPECLPAGGSQEQRALVGACRHEGRGGGAEEGICKDWGNLFGSHPPPGISKQALARLRGTNRVALKKTKAQELVVARNT